MQIKSLIAVLALAVAVVATPVEPVAVKLVERTTPPTIQEICTAKQKVVTICYKDSSPVSASQLFGLISILSGILQNVELQCIFGAVGGLVNSNTATCCDAPAGTNTNTQNNNLVALNVQGISALNCVKAL